MLTDALQRNAIRREAKLPLLNVRAELERTMAQARLGFLRRALGDTGSDQGGSPRRDLAAIWPGVSSQFHQWDGRGDTDQSAVRGVCGHQGHVRTIR
jgi:hypothetical protein